MSFIDPRLRTRAPVAPVAARAPKPKTNAELFEDFLAYLPGRLATTTAESYRNYVRDALAYFHTETGEEIPVREWTKDLVWAYLHHVEQNYCRKLNSFTSKEGTRVVCLNNVWIGHKAPEDGLELCRTCPLFERPTIEKRIHALNRWMGYLASLGYVPVNFIRDVLAENTQATPRHARTSKGEKKRNPTVAETVRLVNGTTHPMKRFVYAANLKWGTRPNEMMALDRFASFGLPTPEGCAEPPGFETAFRYHPEAKGFGLGGRLAYIPDHKGALDKRQGNRWLVVDDELKPLLLAAFEWWERKVKRHPDGRPVHTRLVINDKGRPLANEKIERINSSWFYADAERLGLMVPGDREKPLRRLSFGTGRHGFEALVQELELAQDWQNHMRGDKLHDARGHYYVPTPLDMERKYLKHIPTLGFSPIPTTDAAPAKAGAKQGASA